MKILYKLTVVLLFFCFCSCIVKAPRYTTVDKVFALKMGMTKEEVNQVLETPPYNFKAMNDSVTVCLYKYRVTDRTTLPFLLKANNGKRILGKYVNLLVTFNKTGHTSQLESCGDCDETIIETKRFDVNKLFTLLTVTLPIVLVYLGIKLSTK